MKKKPLIPDSYINSRLQDADEGHETPRGFYKKFSLSNLKFRPTVKAVEDDAVATSHARIIICLGVICIAYMILMVRLFDISFSNKDDYKIKSSKVVSNDFYLQRASIHDRNGNILAVNVPTASLYANPQKVIDKKATAEKLCQLFVNEKCDEIKNGLESSKPFVWIKRHLTPNEQQKIHDLGLPGLTFIKDEKRVYPHVNLFAHVIGYVDIDGNGLAGVEKYFDGVLNSKTSEPLVLSVDSRIQEILRNEILKQVIEHSAIGGSGVVMNVKNGEVLAMVSLPDFDPHQTNRATERQRFNQVTLGVYEMGSVFKVLTMAMGLDGNHVEINDAFDTDAVIKVGKKQIHNYRNKGGVLSVPEILMYSSNVGTAQIALKVGNKKQREYLEQIGLLSVPSIELPEKSSPLYPSSKLWTQASLITISYGHGIAIPPLHMAQAFAGVVNDGKIVKPTLLKLDKDHQPDYRKVISGKSSEIMRKILRLVVSDGFGKKANADGYLVAGKTGTAEKVTKRGYNKKANIASFIGAFPIDEPEYVVLILIDEATPNAANGGFTTGGMLAAPVAGSVITQIAPILGVKPRDHESPEIIEKLKLNYVPRKTF